jgi:hypothetical protein
MYRVLASRPKTIQTEEVAYITEGKTVYFHKITSWPELGTANSYEEAREKFGGRPVLEHIGNVH